MTVMLRKPSKSDYAIPSAHCPIALINTFAKILSACITEDLTHMAEMHKLLPANHFSCQPGRPTTYSLHSMSKYIKDAWWRHEVVSTLFLDGKSAFPSVLLGCLLHDMRQRGVPAQYTEWIQCKVENRKISLRLMDMSRPHSGCPGV